jgi:hypothetical protein
MKISVYFWIEMKKDGFKIGEISGDFHYYLKLASASFAGDTRHQARSRISYCKRLITQ